MQRRKSQCIIISDRTLRVLDQTKLPNTIEYVDISNCSDAWQVIKDMKVRGAPLISLVALQGLKVELQNLLINKPEKIFGSNVDDCNASSNFIEFIKIKAEYLKTSRHTAVNMANDLEDLVKTLEGLSISPRTSHLQTVYEFIENKFIEYEKSSYEIAKNGADLIIKRFSNKPEITILTICNTGELAMPGVGTAMGIIREVFNRNKLKTLYIPETRPYNQGSRLTAFEAMNNNLPGVLITDSMAGSLMRNKMVDCVIVGADRITKLGYTANKIGTYSLSVLAKHHKIPFYVAAPFSTIDLNINHGKEILIEERPADELRKIQEIYLTPKDMPVWNPSFDITPPQLIDSIITEKGYYEFDNQSDHLNSDWEKLHLTDIENYLKLIGLFDENEDITITDVADGNLNYVHRVQGNSKVYCVKQALPWVKCVGSNWPLSIKRISFEAAAFQYQQHLCPKAVPKFYHFNEDKSLLITEFLTDHIILRKGLISNIKYSNLGKNLAEFIATTCYFSSDLYLNAQIFRERISFWNDNSLCLLTEQVIFSDPYYEAMYNRHTSPYLDNIAKEIRNNHDLIEAIFKLRLKFINTKQALLHGDLHSGSIMVDSDEKGEKEQGSCKIIDPEFAFYGPIGFDTGSLIAHFFISYFSTDNTDYRNWLLNEIIIFWSTFESMWTDLCSNLESKTSDEFILNCKSEIFPKIITSYLAELFIDTLGFIGAEIIRRILGIAHVEDFESISDQEQRANKEKLVLRFAVALLTDTKREIRSVHDLTETAKKFKC